MGARKLTGVHTTRRTTGPNPARCPEALILSGPETRPGFVPQRPHLALAPLSCPLIGHICCLLACDDFLPFLCPEGSCSSFNTFPRAFGVFPSSGS